MARDRGSRRSEDALIKPVAIDRWPRGISCEGGFRLLGTPLAFPGARRPGLLFAGHVDSVSPGRGQRLLATPFTAAALDAGRRELDVLTLEFERRIRLGRMDFRLLPSGRGTGAAQLEVHYRDRRIVYTDGVRLAAPLHGNPAEIPRCDLLLLDTAPAEPKPPAPRRTAARLVDWVGDRLGREVPVVACGNKAAALDAARELFDAGIRLRAARGLYELLFRVASQGFGTGDLCRLEQDLPRDCAILYPAHLWPGSRFAGMELVRTVLAGPGRERPEWAEAGFRLGEIEDRPGLVDYVQKSEASQVALGRSCDAATAAALQRTGVAVFRVERPMQIPLPI
ncbi:MAG: hypothetical protein R6V85_13875 [Polyangia bacterium]